jgi:alpha-galactosidase
MSAEAEIRATRISHDISLDSRNSAKDWEQATPISFSADWQGENADPTLETEVRVLWSPATLYLRFLCRYRDLFVFQDSDPNGRRDHLWDRDVAEAFLQPEPSSERRYKEFEVAPNGMWIDLDISPAGLADLESGLTRSVHMDEKQRIWVAEMAIPMRALTDSVETGAVWRANFYRVEGSTEPRQYLAWQPTFTEVPNFHVPQAFGTLRFA